MGSIPKVVGVLACGCLLGLGLALNAPPTTIIKGEVWHVEPSSYFVKQYDGNQVRLQIDETTQMTGRIDQGEHIEAKVAEVNNQKYALAIRSAP